MPTEIPPASKQPTTHADNGRGGTGDRSVLCGRRSDGDMVDVPAGTDCLECTRILDWLCVDTEPAPPERDNESGYDWPMKPSEWKAKIASLTADLAAARRAAEASAGMVGEVQAALDRSGAANTVLRERVAELERCFGEAVTSKDEQRDRAEKAEAALKAALAERDAERARAGRLAEVGRRLSKAMAAHGLDSFVCGLATADKATREDEPYASMIAFRAALAEPAPRGVVLDIEHVAPLLRAAEHGFEDIPEEAWAWAISALRAALPKAEKEAGR